MRPFYRTALLMMLAGTFLIGSCGLSIRKNDWSKESSERPEITESMPETDPIPTSAASVKPTVKPIPSVTPTPYVLPATPTPKPTPKPTPLPLNKHSHDIAALLQDVSVTDNEGRVFHLKKGQVIGIFNVNDNKIEETTRFFLGSGVWYIVTEDLEIFFERSIGKYGAHCFSGIPEHLLFGTAEIMDSKQKRVVEVEPWIQQINLSSEQRYIMRVDWDRDGVIDELSFELEEYHWYWRTGGGVFLFTNGADGSSVRKEMEELSIEDDSGIDVYAETLLLMQKPNGDYIVVICSDIYDFLEGSGPVGSAVFMFDSEEGFIMEKIEQVIEYKDDVLYTSGTASFFGWNWMTKTAARMNNDLSFDVLSGTEEYLNSWCGFTYTLQEVNIEIEGPSGYTPFVLSAGMVIIPEKEVLNSEGKGYLYVRLADGRKARIKAEFRYESDERIALLDGLPDTEAFSFSMGG
ncbi:MAG: hypothetical protein PHF65_07850 [Oscillospiraceae bacterium]|nr:hypothetical protein [Oscillospiraceae bacterium]